MISISTYPLPGIQLLEFAEELRQKEIHDVGFELFYDNIPFYNAKSYRKFMPDFVDGKLGMHCPMEGCDLLAPKGSLTLRYTIEKHKRCFNLAKNIGSSYCVIHTNCLDSFDVSERDNRILLIDERMRKISKLAEAYGLEAYIENVGFENAGSLMADYDKFKKLSEKHFMLLDTGHAQVNGWNIPELIASLGNKIKGFHFHDNDGKCDLHAPILKGTSDWEGIFNEVKKIKKCEFTLEYSPMYVSRIINDIELLRKELNE